MSTGICLTMIVRNEAMIIERCIESVADFIHAVAIVDTGSKDKTKQGIVNVAERHRLPYRIIDSPWRDDFSFHRNEAMRLATQLVGDSGSALSLDADETVMNGLCDAVQLADKFDVVSGWLCDDDFRYKKNFVVRLSSFLRWTGSRHEIMRVSEIASRAIAQEFLVSYGHDGARRTDVSTFSTDVEHLRTKLELGENARQNFRNAWHLARTFEAKREFIVAAETFANAASFAEHDDEVFQAKWGILRCEQQIEPSNAEQTAYDLCVHSPERAEGWLARSQLAYTAGFYEDALSFALRAGNCVQPTDTWMFDRAAYSWLPLEIAAHASDRLGCSRTDFKRLLTAAIALRPASSLATERIANALRMLDQ